MRYRSEKVFGTAQSQETLRSGGVLFGPVGFALTGASVAFVVVNAGLASALHAAAGG